MAQIDRTMKVVHAILESRGMAWRNTTRAIAYFQDMKSAPLLADYCRANGIMDLPVVNAHATVCRHDLLFEIELDAVVSPAVVTPLPPSGYSGASAPENSCNCNR